MADVPLHLTDLNPFINQYPAGTAFQFLEGLYRLTTKIVPRTGDVFVGHSPCGERLSVLSGARVLTGWTRQSCTQREYWMLSGQTQQGDVPFLDVCIDGWGGCIYPEDLFIDNEVKKHVLSVEGARSPSRLSGSLMATSLRACSFSIHATTRPAATLVTCTKAHRQTIWRTAIREEEEHVVSGSEPHG